jgi:LPS sulfotransferase NodH
MAKDTPTQQSEEQERFPNASEHKAEAEGWKPRYKNMTEMFEDLNENRSEPDCDPAALDNKVLSERYAICMTPRTGSTYLAYMMRDTKAFGFPDEWLSLHRAKSEAVSVGATEPASLLKRVLAKYASENGVSGVEIALGHLVSARRAGAIDVALDRKMKFFYLRRRNIVRQGLSMHSAHQSGVLHSFQMNEDAKVVRDAVIYDTLAVRQHIKMLHDEELMWEREFGARHIEPDRIYYEDIVQRPDRILRRFAHILGLSETPIVPAKSEITKVTDDRTDEWEARYRDEDADYLAALTRHRPLVHVPMQMT